MMDDSISHMLQVPLFRGVAPGEALDYRTHDVGLVLCYVKTGPT